MSEASLAKFQRKAVARLLKKAVDELKDESQAVILLEAPTGAGKTVMASHFMQQLVTKLELVTFIWLAPNKLQEQALARMKALKTELPGLRFIGASELNKSLARGDVLFLNWASVDKKENNLRSGDERGITLEKVIELTREEGKRVVLVIDESHVHVGADAANEVIHELIRPDLTVEVSATPSIDRYDTQVVVRREDVVDEGYIRDEIVINPGMQDFMSVSADDSDVRIEGVGDFPVVLQAALEYRARLSNCYHEHSLTVNPLILVQFPDGPSGDRLMGEIEDLLAGYGISVENGKLAVWLSEDKQNLKGIEEKTGVQEVLFFKQAIAIGWDCPRAQILVSLREMKTNSFTAQVLGRVLRQPDRRKYKLPLLDRAYVFTNADSFKLTKELEDILPRKEVRASQSMTVTVLNWKEESRFKGYLALKSLEDDILAAATDKAHPVSKLTHRGPVLGHMLSDVLIENPDVARVVEGNANYPLSAHELGAAYDTLVRSLATRFQNSSDARRFVRSALEQLACEAADVHVNISMPTNVVARLRVMETMLHPENRPAYENLVRSVTDDFISNQEKVGRTFSSRVIWATPSQVTVRPSEKARWVKSCYSAYPQPFTDVELQVAAKLETTTEVKVWVKNGNGGNDWFALKYIFQGSERLFFPDFLVELNDGRVVFIEGKGHGAAGTAAHSETQHKAAAMTEVVIANPGEVLGFFAALKNGILYLTPADRYSWNPELVGWKPVTGTLSDMLRVAAT